MFRIVIGIILIVVGAFYMLLPKKVVQFKSGEKEPKPEMIRNTRIGGIVTIVIGVGFIIYGLFTM